MDDWPDTIGGDEDDDAELDAQIALAEFHLSMLRTAKALREFGRAAEQATEALGRLGDAAVLGHDVIDDSYRQD